MTNNAWNSDVPVETAKGGTGQDTYTNAQLLIGVTASNTLQKGVLKSDDASVTIAYDDPDIDLSVNVVALPWTEVTGTTQQMAGNNGYIANNVALVTLTLPPSVSQGAVVRVAGKGAGTWRIAQNAGQTIHFGTSSSTTGAAGYVEATEQRDSILLLCDTQDTDFTVLSVIGNLTVN